MTDLQRQVYEHFTSSEAARRMLRAAEGGKSKQAPRVCSAALADLSHVRHETEVLRRPWPSIYVIGRHDVHLPWPSSTADIACDMLLRCCLPLPH